MRVTEAFQTVPTFLLALALVGVLGASAGNVVLAIAISSWPPAARLVRAEVLRVKTLDYVDAARIAGMAPALDRLRRGPAGRPAAGRGADRGDGRRGHPGRERAGLSRPRRPQPGELGRHDRQWPGADPHGPLAGRAARNLRGAHRDRRQPERRRASLPGSASGAGADGPAEAARAARPGGRVSAAGRRLAGGGEWRRSRPGARPGAGGDRRERLGQEQHSAGDRWPAGGGREGSRQPHPAAGCDRLPGTGGRPRRARRAPGGDDLPASGAQPQSGAADRHPARRGGAGASPARPAGCAPGQPGAAGAGRHRCAGAPGAGLSAPALGRPEAARGDRRSVGGRARRCCSPTSRRRRSMP